MFAAVLTVEAVLGDDSSVKSRANSPNADFARPALQDRQDLL